MGTMTCKKSGKLNNSAGVMNSAAEEYCPSRSSELRALDNMLAVGARHCAASRQLSQGEYETLLDIFLGLTNKAIAARRHLTVRGVNHRIMCLTSKLLGLEDNILSPRHCDLLNVRCRLVMQALSEGILRTEQLAEEQESVTGFLLNQRSRSQKGAETARQIA